MKFAKIIRWSQKDLERNISYSFFRASNNLNLLGVVVKFVEYDSKKQLGDLDCIIEIISRDHILNGKKYSVNKKILCELNTCWVKNEY